MGGGTIINSTANAVLGSDRISPPNGLSIVLKKISHWGAVVSP